jgi:hypothetical protein
VVEAVSVSLEQLVSDIADACVAIDRSGIPFKTFRPGVGPYGEPQLVKLVAAHLNNIPLYAGRTNSERTPDLLVAGVWALEFNIARPYGDNGLEAENWSVNLLHPYPDNESIFGNCLDLAAWQGPERRAAIVIGFEHDPAKTPLDPLFRAFEAIASQQLPVALSARCEAVRRGLAHPVHQVVRVAGWEVPPLTL